MSDRLPYRFGAFAVVALIACAGAAAQNNAPAQKDDKPAAAPAAQPSEKADKPAEKQAEKQAVKELAVGDKAPPLAIERWVKGEPITGFEKGKVYVVEFWATWCGPCIDGMPHLTEVQEEYKDKGVTIVGINIWDDPKNVDPFMADRGDKPSGDKLMGYTVGVEKKHDPKNVRNGIMARDWMTAAGQNGIPSSFIIDKTGTVAFIGHPSTLDKPLKEITAGTYDIKKAAADFIKARETQKVMTKFNKELAEAMKAKDAGAAMAVIDKMEAASPEAKDGLVMRRFMILTTLADDYKAAYALAAKNIDGAWKDNPMALNEVAWTIVDPEGKIPRPKQDLDVAFKAASRAVELTQSKNGMILDTLARVHFNKGEVQKAIEIQTKAVEASKDPMKSQLQDTLDEYKEAASKSGG